MYVKDGICYARELEEGIKVTETKPLDGGMMLVTFSTGEQRLFDTTRLEGSAFAPLTNERIFRNPTIFHGVITWDDGEHRHSVGNRLQGKLRLRQRHRLTWPAAEKIEDHSGHSLLSEYIHGLTWTLDFAQWVMR